MSGHLDDARRAAAENLSDFARTQDDRHARVLLEIASRLALSVCRPLPDGTPSALEVMSRDA